MNCVRVEEGRGGRCGLYERGGDVGMGGRKKGKGGDVDCGRKKGEGEDMGCGRKKGVVLKEAGRREMWAV